MRRRRKQKCKLQTIKLVEMDGAPTASLVFVDIVQTGSEAYKVSSSKTRDRFDMNEGHEREGIHRAL